MFGGTLSALRTAVDEAVAVDPAELGDVGLADELIGVQAEVDRLQGQVTRLAHAAHVRGLGCADGSPSTAAWLRRRTGMREGEARAAIEAGDACDETLAGTGEAWRAGEITAGAARTIIGARVDGHDAKLAALEPLLLGMARDRQDRELRRACAHFRNLAHADGTSPRDLDGLSISQTYAGRTWVTAALSSDGAEIFLTALHELTDPPAPDDPRTPARRRADALIRMAELAMANLHRGDGPTRARVAASIVIDWTTLTNGVPGRLDGGYTGMLHPGDIDRLLCDCTISRVVTGPDSIPIDVGRARRTIPPALNRARMVRDGGCRFPGCTRPPGWTDAHHVIHWRHGGRTDLVNLVSLCDYHHHVVHQPGWTVKFDGHELRILKPDGTEIRGP